MSVKVFSGNRMIDTVKGSVIEKKISILVENEIIVAIDSPDKISSHPLFENSEKIKKTNQSIENIIENSKEKNTDKDTIRVRFKNTKNYLYFNILVFCTLLVFCILFGVLLRKLWLKQ